jgi:hypothetical protein
MAVPINKVPVRLKKVDLEKIFPETERQREEHKIR